VKPRFGIITKVIAGAFALAGIGAGLAVFGDRSPVQVLILCLLTAAFLIVAVGMWTEFVWAWWAGASVTLLTIVMGRILKIASVGLVWPAILVGFVVSGVQGLRVSVRRGSRRS
jgi:hypothetical protein